jgi:hypothetical protein
VLLRSVASHVVPSIMRSRIKIRIARYCDAWPGGFEFQILPAVASVAAATIAKASTHLPSRRSCIVKLTDQKKLRDGVNFKRQKK